MPWVARGLLCAKPTPTWAPGRPKTSLPSEGPHAERVCQETDLYLPIHNPAHYLYTTAVCNLSLVDIQCTKDTYLVMDTLSCTRDLVLVVMEMSDCKQTLKLIIQLRILDSKNNFFSFGEFFFFQLRQ